MSLTRCRHCCKGRINRPRGLCWNCYYAPGVRDLYPTDPVYGHRGICSSGERPAPANPTHHPPGTPGKLDVMVARAEAGEHIHHPDDAKSHDNYQAA
jgi:hypothetical protein